MNCLFNNFAILLSIIIILTLVIIGNSANFGAQIVTDRVLRQS